MKPFKTIALLLTLTLVLSLCACGAESGSAPSQSPTSTVKAGIPTPPPTDEDVTQTSHQLTVTDLVGRQLTVTPGSYTRIVCIGAGALRMYCYVGDVSLLCGVEDIDNLSLEERPKMFDSVARPYVLAYGDTFLQLPSCGVGGPNAQTAEAEKLLSCNPDLVISQYEDADKADALQQQLGVPVITLRTGPNGVFADEFIASLTLLGQVLNKEDRAVQLISYVGDQTEELKARTADIPEEEKPSVYICGLGNWGTTNHLSTSQNFSTFQVANIKNVVTGLSSNGVQSIEEEKFISLGADMDYMFIDAAAVKNIMPLYQEDSTMFDCVKAWNEGNVYLELAYNAYYTNHEIALANAWFMAKTVYPDRFEDIDITAKMDEITQMFLGSSLTDEIFACPSSQSAYQVVTGVTGDGSL